jgi:hypothetical protein
LVDPAGGAAAAGENVTWQVNSSGVGFDIWNNGYINTSDSVPEYFTDTATLSLDDQGWHLAAAPSEVPGPTYSGNPGTG